jgi:hypothetical protein
LPKRIL